MEYKVVSSGTNEGLTRIVESHIKNGWKPIGSHSVVTTHSQNRFAGSQHMDTKHEVEYSQTMVKEKDERLKLYVNGDSVNIEIDNGEGNEPTHVVYWDISEMEEDGSVAISIANAVKLFYTDPKKLFETIGLDYDSLMK